MLEGPITILGIIMLREITPLLVLHGSRSGGVAPSGPSPLGSPTQVAGLFCFNCQLYVTQANE